jgi:peptide/nickel transport system permease protein
MIEAGSPELAVAGARDINQPDPAMSTPVVMAGTRRAKARRVSFFAALGWLALVLLLAILAPVLPIADYAVPVGPPRLGVGARWPEFLGTDPFGRSVLSRIVYGSRQSLLIAVAAVAGAFTVGGIIGTLAGYLGGATDRVVSIIVDSFLALPPIMVLLALTAALRPGTTTLIISLGAIVTPGVIRVARAQALNFSQRDYIHAARVMGATHGRIIRRFIAPSLLQPLSTFAVIQLSLVMIAEGSLSFLGLGVPLPKPSWGEMIATGQGQLPDRLNLVFVPGAMFVLTVISLNIVGEHARRRDRRTSKLN